MTGFSLPILNILIVLIAVLTYFWGWIVLAIVLAIFFGTTFCVAMNDYFSTRRTYSSSTQKTYPLYDLLYSDLYSPKNIERSRVTIKTQKKLSDHMLIRTWVDGKPDLNIRMDYNQQYEIID